MPRITKTVDGLRQCNICRETKSVEEFGMNGRWHKSYCKQCGKKDLQNRRTWLNSFKDKPCADCGSRYPTVLMDFDHVPERGPKLGKISTITNRQKALEEIAKCDVVCPVCHRIRTATRAGLLTEEELNVLSKL